MTAPLATPRLRRLARRPGEERCDLRSEPLPGGHRHLPDVRAGAASRARRACSPPSDRKEAGGAHHRLPPRRGIRLEEDGLDDALRASPGIPAGPALLTRGGESGEAAAGHPSPLGPPRSTVDADRRPAVGTCAPAVAATAGDVEALLVNRANDARKRWTVPPDDCRLPAAVARTHRKGPGGGSEVRGHFGDFLRGLRADPPAAGPTDSPPAT